MAKLSPPDRTAQRLAAVCARLASDFDGERAVAARLASHMLTAAGLTWQELVSRAFAVPAARQKPPRETAYRQTDHEAALQVYRDLLASVELNGWEQHFLETLLEDEIVVLSERQQRIVDKLMRRRANAQHHARASP